ncbi:hypothetical protein ALC57_01991 [Trachymyrmex cornetzi]|uniref:Uncharacterized protein n=1 Tax=Trachymyrmex cornetzi TaxID=471704 RepID=A0A151JPS7_9HYME|nr:hypothetical protein ALC57_01991 [Trachymyrmex cornetzi]
MIGPPKKFEIFDCSYDALTEKIEIDTLVGMRRKSEKGFTDMKMIQVITELYDLDRDSVILSVYKNCYITEIRNMHYRLKRMYNSKIVFVWVPSHIGILGHETADELAKEAASEEEDRSIYVPIQDLRRVFKTETWNYTQETITREELYKGKFYFENYYDINKTKPWFCEMNEERYFITFVNRIRSNHYNLGVSLYRKNYVDSERCECDYERESLDHFIWQCSRYDELRFRLDQELRLRKVFHHVDVCELIKSEIWSTLRVIFNYIKKTNRII